MSALTRHDDLDALRGKRFRVPELFRHGAWLAVPVGQRSMPGLGPSSTQILLWLYVDTPATWTWDELEKAIGAPRGPTSRTAPADAMGALLLGNTSVDRTVQGNQWIVRGTEYPADAFGNIYWRHGWALGTRAGLLVSAVSG
ncbi:hypothetical protein [Sorangium sp. So ce861]|uniref:hypothetical protein n=1 Tax=Sorangium sp. So ce861 TaxID=3133323 RepID=UPI003F621661